MLVLEKTILEWFLSYMGMAAILVTRLEPSEQAFVSLQVTFGFL